MKLDSAFAWMKERTWFIVAAIALVASFFARFEICEPTKFRHFEHCASHNLLYVLISIFDAHNGTVAAIAGILVAIFTATLYWTAKQEFLTTHRPALVVHNVAFELAKEPGTERQRENGCIMAYVVNEGGTPATVFEYTGWLYRERKAPWTVVGGRSSLRHREDFQRGANRPGWRRRGKSTLRWTSSPLKSNRRVRLLTSRCTSSAMSFTAIAAGYDGALASSESTIPFRGDSCEPMTPTTTSTPNACERDLAGAAP